VYAPSVGFRDAKVRDYFSSVVLAAVARHLKSKAPPTEDRKGAR
jgi:hypothetical protein